MTDPIVFGAPRKVHYAKKRCGAKNRYLVSTDWNKVTCSFCLKLRIEKPQAPLPKGVQYAAQACRCGDCFRCVSRRRERKKK